MSEELASPPTPVRKTPPPRRVHEVIEFRHDGQRYRGSVSYVDDKPIEVFLEGGKNGSPLQAMARDCAVATSLALQYGVPFELLRQTLTRNEAGAPVGPLGAFLDQVIP